jgi:hypothetical protein
MTSESKPSESVLCKMAKQHNGGIALRNCQHLMSRHHYSMMLVLVLSCLIHKTLAAPTDSEYVTAPYIKCFNTKCDLRTSYCDQGIESCAACNDDCHPARTAGNSAQQQDCITKCAWYYVWKEATESVTSVTTTTQKSQSTETKPTSAGWATEWTQLPVVPVAFLLTMFIILLLGVSNVLAWCLVYRSTRRYRFSRIHLDSRPHCTDNLASKLSNPTIYQPVETKPKHALCTESQSMRSYSPQSTASLNNHSHTGSGGFMQPLVSSVHQH